MNILVLGSSASAVSFVDTYRKHNSEDTITVLTEEIVKPYFRPMLSHMLGKEEIPGNFFIKNDEFFDKNNIDIKLGEKVIKIDIENKKVLTSRTSYAFDKLIVAIGSNNFLPPVQGIELENVCDLKFFNDLKNINNNLNNIDDITIIGGGLLGIEAAWALNSAGKHVTILEFSNKLMARQLDIAASSFLEKKLNEAGISVHTSANVVELLGNKKVKGYKLQDGSEHTTEMILYSIGVRPNIGLLKDAGININRGILVNENYLTSNSDVYALGDVAEINGIVHGTWTDAMKSGKIAAMNLLNKEIKEQNEISMPVILKALDIDVASIGNIDEECGLVAEIDEDRYIRYFVKNEICIGAIVIGDKKQARQLSSVINKKFDKQ